MNEKTTIARMRDDGTVVQVLSDGSEIPFPDRPPMREMTDEEVEAAALSDPDAQPLTEEDFARMKRVPRTKIIRRALRLTQEEFAARYRIPLGTLRDWEQGRSEPDQAANAYLKVIAANPEMVKQILQGERDVDGQAGSAKAPTPIPSPPTPTDGSPFCNRNEWLSSHMQA